MIEDFIPYEEALALKELGFCEPCYGYYDDYKIISSHSDSPLMMCDYNHSEEEENALNPISAPLYQQVFRWFREKHDLHCGVDNSIVGFYGIIRIRDTNSSLYHSKWVNTQEYPFKTHEEADVACLKKLIEIIKK